MKPLRIYPEFFNHVIISSSRVSGCGGQHLICSHDGSCQLWLWSPKGPQLVQHMDILDKSLHPSGFQAGGYSRFKFCKIWHDTIIYFVRYFMMLYGSKLVDQNGWRVFRWWKNLRWAELKAYELSRSILQEPCSLWSHRFLLRLERIQNFFFSPLTLRNRNIQKLMCTGRPPSLWKSNMLTPLAETTLFKPGGKTQGLDITWPKEASSKDIHAKLFALHVTSFLPFWTSLVSKSPFWKWPAVSRGPSPVQHVSHLSEL